MAACATLLPGETKQVLVKLDSGESGVTFATVDSGDKLTIRAALYETSTDGTVFISVSNESEFGLHYDVGDALAEADEVRKRDSRITPRACFVKAKTVARESRAEQQ